MVGILSTGDAAAAPIVDAIATRLQSHGKHRRARAARRNHRCRQPITPNLSKRSAKTLDRRGARQRLGFGGRRQRLGRSLATICCRAKRPARGPGGSSPRSAAKRSASARHRGAGPPDHHDRTGPELVGSAAAGFASRRRRRRHRLAGAQNRRPIPWPGAGGWRRSRARALRGLRRAHSGRRRHRSVRRNECRRYRRGSFAMGMERRRRPTRHANTSAQTSPLGDYTLPAMALTRGGRIDRIVARFFGGALIEHLPRGFFSVSTDMITGDQIIHRRGSLALAVRASISIPGLIPPVQHGERLLIDGGLLNNLPADVMCDDRDGEVICVDLRRNFRAVEGFWSASGHRPASRFVRRLLTGTDAALPPLQETLLRTVDLAASNVNLLELPRIAAIIEPDISSIGPLDFKKFDARWRQGGSRRVQRWKHSRTRWLSCQITCATVVSGSHGDVFCRWAGLVSGYEFRRLMDRDAITAAFDALDAAFDAVAELKFDALTTPERLALLERCERVRRRLPTVEHPLINQLARQATPEELGGKLSHAVAEWTLSTPRRGRAGASGQPPIWASGAASPVSRWRRCWRPPPQHNAPESLGPAKSRSSAGFTTGYRAGSTTRLANRPKRIWPSSARNSGPNS